MICSICGKPDGHSVFDVREMMFGFRDAFRYFECGACGCLQIAGIPEDISRYYPDNYYSYQADDGGNIVRKFLIARRDRHAFTGRGAVGRLLYARYPNEALRSLARLPITKDTRILDVGCGSGTLLRALHRLGMRQLLGIDPYNDGDRDIAAGLRILKRDLRDVEGEWDLVMFHHSFEHLADPEGVLRKVASLLSSDAVCVIRIPVSSSHAWREYGVDWVQLDAPRHFFLHSVRSMEILADRCGLDLREVTHDSSAFQFWGSEQYRRDIPLRDERSHVENPKNSGFTKAEIAAFTARAEELNAAGQGDQAVFYLSPRKRD
jgi:SAM-dependent methyltransferase